MGIVPGVHLRGHDFHNDGEENSKPGLGEEIVDDEGGHRFWWLQVQRGGREGGGYNGAD